MTIRTPTLEATLFWRRRIESAEPLVERLRAGEHAAVGEAYDLHAAAVRAFARRLVGDPDEAEDLVQEVFVTLAKAARRFDGRSALRTFILGIAVRHAQHHVRAAMRRRKAWQRSAEVQHSSIAGPERASADLQLARLLEIALDELPIDQRVAFVLCEVEERTSAEVAVIVDAPEATVRTRLFHARRKLREKLEEMGVR